MYCRAVAVGLQDVHRVAAEVVGRRVVEVGEHRRLDGGLLLDQVAEVLPREVLAVRRLVALEQLVLDLGQPPQRQRQVVGDDAEALTGGEEVLDVLLGIVEPRER